MNSIPFFRRLEEIYPWSNVLVIHNTSADVATEILSNIWNERDKLLALQELVWVWVAWWSDTVDIALLRESLFDVLKKFDY